LFVLTTLAESPALSLAEVADRALTDQSSVSTVVSRLVSRGLIVRKASTKDRRRAELRLTPAGHRVLQAAPPVPQARLIDAIRALPAPRRTELVRALEALVESVGADGVKPRLFFHDDPA
jgi:DNA-binding MarR family transcriptional regulator